MKSLIQKLKNVPKNIWLLIGAVAAVVIVVLVVRAFMHRRPEAPVADVVPDVQIQNPDQQTAPVVMHGRRRRHADAVAMAAYTPTVEQYFNNRIQFGNACQAMPTTSTYKVGTDILLDNRSADAATIVIGGQTYKLGSYGFQVAHLTTEGTFLVDCNNQQNVTTIVVQK
ncbi:MAG: hypothetical protein WCQ32_01090 [bacterium]